MGYTLTIGEAELEYWAKDQYLTISAQGATHEDAPDHCPYTGKGNSRSPSYSTWNEFCREAGLFELFYGGGWNRDYRQYDSCSDDFHRDTPLLNKHPGAQPLCKGDLDLIRACRIRREQTNDGKPPGFWEGNGDIDNGTDPVLARLLWLEFWVDWALQNCKIPILENT